jgi:hypothetical protein
MINADLIRRLRAASAGRIEWRIVSPDGNRMAMWFSREGPDAVLDPEREAREWLRQHQADYPERFAGYTVERAVALNQADQLMQEAADELEKSDAQVVRFAASAAQLAIPRPRPLDEWNEEDSCVLWWKFPLEEDPYVGHPNCESWTGYHTHWTPIVCPGEPTA